MVPLTFFILYVLMMSLSNSNLKTSLIKVLSDSSFKKLKPYHKFIEFIISHYTYI